MIKDKGSETAFWHMLSFLGIDDYWKKTRMILVPKASSLAYRFCIFCANTLTSHFFSYTLLVVVGPHLPSEDMVTVDLTTVNSMSR